MPGESSAGKSTVRRKPTFPAGSRGAGSETQKLNPVISALPSLRLQRVLRDGSDPIALSTLQPGMRYLDTPRGFIAYQRAFGVSLSLGGPVGAAQAAKA